MTNPMVWHEGEVRDALGGTRLQQAIVSFVTMGGLMTSTGCIAVETVKSALRISDEAWEREFKELSERCDVWESQPGRVISGLAYTLCQYATGGIAGRPQHDVWRRLRRHATEDWEWRRGEPVRCVVCDATDTLALDHKVPVARGGSNHPLNLQWLCVPCNSSKGTKTMDEWRGHP